MKTAQEIAELYKNGEKLGLSQEELAFYDALTKPEHIKDFYKNEELIALTRELTEMLRLTEERNSQSSDAQDGKETSQKI